MVNIILLKRYYSVYFCILVFRTNGQEFDNRNETNISEIGSQNENEGRGIYFEIKPEEETKNEELPLKLNISGSLVEDDESTKSKIPLGSDTVLLTNSSINKDLFYGEISEFQGSSGKNVSNEVASQKESLNNSKSALEKVVQGEHFHPRLTIRKCCTISQYFNLKIAGCENSSESSEQFFEEVSNILPNVSTERVDILSGTLQNCSQNGGTPFLTEPSNFTHSINENGQILDIYSGDVYPRSEYCLEILGEDLFGSKLTLAYCPKIVSDYSYYNYDDHNTDDSVESEQEDHIIGDSEFTVRKCCEENEYFNQVEKRCEAFHLKNAFSEAVKALSFENGVKTIKVESSPLKECPSDYEELVTKEIKAEFYRLRYNGVIIDILTGISYDSSQYCLEQLGEDERITNLTMTFCFEIKNMIPKCCPSEYFFDSTLLECLPSKYADNNQSERLLDIFRIDKSEFELKPLSHLLSCKSTFPSQEYVENIHFNDASMCAKGNCYKNRDYCIELSRTRSMKVRPIAFFCQTDFFVKCCPQGQILDNNGCSEHFDKSSFLMKQLSRTRKAVTAFDYRKCSGENAVLLEESLSSHLQWWVGKDGSTLMIETEIETKQIHQYCIDDFADFKRDIQPSAFVCAEEVKHMIPKNVGMRAFQNRGSLGKCCQRDSVDGFIYYFSLEESKCKQVSAGRISKNNSFILEAGLSKEHFHDFPDCSSITGYHTYPLLNNDSDHGVLTSDGDLKIVSMDGKCISREEIIQSSDFCYEFFLAEDGTLQPLAFVCAVETVLEVYHEKFGIVSTLLGISCVCLFAALVYLLTVKVRRGVVSIRKINTLAGKIMISFVGSHFIGYISLLLTQHENHLNKTGTVWCYILASFIQFFNLATFCWNTSICLESLLLTIHIRISDGLRYFLHSLWAWGFPALMTTLMIVIDKYRDSLPCNTIAPKIGVHHCFYSNDNAHLLYFYVPIFITLTANILFLLGAKALRRSRLRKLEMGPRHRNKDQAAGQGKSETSGKSNSQTPASSGMRTHQSHNTKAESLRIVLWTGGTWFLELAGFVITKYLLPHRSERWYDYLWYIPTSVNALRGVGIFAIVVLTPDVKSKLSIHFRRVRDSFISTARKWGFNCGRSDSEDSLAEREASAVRRDRGRNMSITTMISNLSSVYNYSSTKIRSTLRRSSGDGTTDEAKRPSRFTMARSVSQIERQNSTSSTLSSEESAEMELETGVPKTKSSSAGSLPKLKEEEDLDPVEGDHEQTHEKDISSSEV